MNLQQLLEAIQHTELERANLQPLPDLIQIEASITFHGARAIVGAEAPRHKAALETLIIQKEQALPIIERNDEITRRLQSLRTQLAFAEAEQARLRREAQQRHEQELVQAYHHAAIQMVRAARKCMDARIDIGSFSVGFLETDPNGPFKLSQEMRMGLLRFERMEQEQQKEAV